MGLARRRHFAVKGRQLLGIEDELFGEGHLGIGTTSDGASPRRARRPARLLHAARRARAGPHRPAGRHRRHHPGRAGRDHPLAAGRRARRAGWPRHRQDRRRPPPRRLPALHVPLPAGGPGRAGHRPQPGVPALHRAGAAVARRGRRRAGRAHRPRARRALRRRRHAASRRRVKGDARMADVIDKAVPRPRAPAPRRPRRAVRPELPAAAVGGQRRIVQAARRRFRRHNAGRRFVEGEVWAALAASSRDAGRAPDAVRDRVRCTGRGARRARADVAGAHAGPAAARPVRLEGAAAPGRPADVLADDEFDVALPAPLATTSTTCAGPTTTSACSTRPASCSARPPVGATAGRRGRRRDPHLRPHRHRRGAGPHADAAAHGRPPLAQRLDDGRRRHRPGHRAARPASWDDVAAPPARSARAPGSSGSASATASRRQIMALAPTGAEGGDAGAGAADLGARRRRPAVDRRASIAAGLGQAVVDAVRRAARRRRRRQPRRRGARLDDGADGGRPRRRRHRARSCRRATGLEGAVTVVPVSVVKGLELDGVVVVEPARIVAEEAQGLRALYVALTRSTKPAHRGARRAAPGSHDRRDRPAQRQRSERRGIVAPRRIGLDS